MKQSTFLARQPVLRQSKPREVRMPKEALPDYKSKQQLLYAKNARPAELEAMGKRFLQAGWLYDAIDFFQRAQSSAGLEMVREAALHDGDVFLLRRVLKASGQEGTDQLWQQAGEEARRRGKLEFALEAFRLAGDRKAMDEIYQMLHPQPVAPTTATEAPPADREGA